MGTAAGGRRTGAPPAERRTRQRDGKSLQYLDSELACRLHITERAAGQLLFLALTLTSERAAAGELLATGLIDLAKASVFAHELDGIDDQLATQIEERLLPQAPALTSGQLRSAIRRMIDKADPEAAARRRRDAIASRDVTRWQNHDRTHTVAIRNVNGSTAGRILARIAARARALKNDGDPRPLHQIRADLASAILLGEYPNGYQPEDPGGRDDLGHPGDPDGPGGPSGGEDDQGGPRPADAAPADEDPRHGPPAGGPPPTRPSGPSQRPGQPDSTGPRPEEDRPAGEPAVDLPFDDHKRAPVSRFPQPRLGHWEPMHAQSGEGEHDQADDPQLRRQREIAVRAAEIIARSLAGLPRPSGPRPRAPAAALACHAAKITQELATVKSSTCIRTTLPGGTTIHGTGTYRPSPWIQQHVEQRDQTCQFPACNRRARICDKDHTIPFHRDGATCVCNIVSLCRHHHIVKQDKNWRVYHPWPGVLVWITPSGQWHIKETLIL